jgi:epoxide hydrolase-like predicted phosphatase
MPINAFLFDCGGVMLRDMDASIYQRWEQRLGLSAGELESRLWQGDIWDQVAVGRITEGQFWQRSATRLGLTDPAHIDALRDDLWDSWTVDAQVLGLVDRLRQRYRVAMLSNATDALEDLLTERYGIADRFDPILNSARLGLVKPDRAIYEAALARLELPAHEIVFVDDHAENVAAAAALGFHVIWFVNAAELERQLAFYLGNGKHVIREGDHHQDTKDTKRTENVGEN